MPDDGIETIKVKVLSGVQEVPAAEWDACAGDANPFVSHAFLRALEESGSACLETGWLPRHLAIEDEGGRLIGAVPVYLKSHSYGEYVFDWSWADAFERAGGRYYPKLQVAVPFTPVTGPRLLVRDGPQRKTTEAALIAALWTLARESRASSIHVTFPTERERAHLGDAGYLLRTDCQFVWENRGYRSFDDFLSDLRSTRRKAIRRERREALAGGIEIETLSGDSIRPHHWSAFHRAYRHTAEGKWGTPYLNREFFARLGETLAPRIVLVLAQQQGHTVAGALNLIGADTLYGRTWGALAEIPSLHFECCYYRAIEFAIARGLKRIEAGAQGPHKIRRGYLPVRTYSAHWIFNPDLRRAIEHYLEAERPAVEEEIAELAKHSPFREER